MLARQASHPPGATHQATPFADQAKLTGGPSSARKPQAGKKYCSWMLVLIVCWFEAFGCWLLVYVCIPMLFGGILQFVAFVLILRLINYKRLLIIFLKQRWPLH